MGSLFHLHEAHRHRGPHQERWIQEGQSMPALPRRFTMFTPPLVCPCSPSSPMQGAGDGVGHSKTWALFCAFIITLLLHGFSFCWGSYTWSQAALLGLCSFYIGREFANLTHCSLSPHQEPLPATTNFANPPKKHIQP